jgi:hypothetical protein
MRFKLLSVMLTSRTMPCLPAKRMVSFPPLRRKWRLRSVVAPKLLFSLAYASLPTRR